MPHSKITFFSLFISFFFLTSCKLPSSKSNTKTFEAMDTFMTIRSFGRKSEIANEKAFERIQQIEKLISTTIPNSEVSILNNANGKKISVSDETLKLVKFTKKGAELSNGAFNPVLYPVTKAWGFTTKNYTVPSEIQINELLKQTDYTKIQIDEEKSEITIPQNMKFDFGAVGKGFAGDEIISIYQKMGIKSALIDLGGNVQVLGTKTDGSPWVIGLKNPWGGEVPLAVYLENCAMITSGGYERYFTADDGENYIHIIDGKTGYPVQNEVVSVTIVCNSGLYADYLSTTLFVLGKDKAIDFWRTWSKNAEITSEPHFDFILMTNDHSLYYTKGLESKISIFAEFNDVYVME